MSTFVSRRADFRSVLGFVLAVVAAFSLGGGAGYLLRPAGSPQPGHSTNLVVDPIADTQTCVFLGPHIKAC
jgi:hypothetical protein